SGNRKACIGAVGADPAHIGFDAKHHRAYLVIEADLAATDEARTSHFVAVDWRTERIRDVGETQRSADVAADVKSAPAPRRGRCLEDRSLERRQICGHG